MKQVTNGQDVGPADRAVLKRLVGATTFTRGRAYASRGAVESREWNDTGTTVSGEVRGAADRPYTASIRLRRTSSRALIGIDAVCSCPVGSNCKHAVALLLTEGTGSPPVAPQMRCSGSGGQTNPKAKPSLRAAAGSERRSSRNAGTRKPAGWEVSLSGLLAQGSDIAPVEPRIGLHFDLVMPSRTAGSSALPRLRVRPVLPGSSGGWVKSGMSWSRLEYHFAYQRDASERTHRQVALLQELQNLSRSGRDRSYYAPDENIWFESINSRRVWDVLAEAQALGVPLLSSAGRRPQPVALHSGPAEMAVDVTGDGSGLVVATQVQVGDEVIPATSSLLVGRPAHGIVWWDEPSTPSTPSAAAPGRLCLARLAAPMPDQLGTLVESGPVRVPARDRERFVRDALPTLRRRVAVRSSDEAVEVPEVTPAILKLSVSHLGGHCIGVAWAWVYRIGGAAWSEDLWAPPGGSRRDGTEEAILSAVVRSVASVPELFEATTSGPRVAEEAELAGMAAVRFATEILPTVLGLPGVEVNQSGSVPDYREAAAPPAVVFDGAASDGGDWFDLTITVSVDGEEVPFADLFIALAEGESHLILPSGTYFSLDRDELRQLAALIAEARGLHEAENDRVRLSRFQTSLWEELVGLGLLTGQARAWEESVRALAEATERSEQAVPAGLRATLRPYQLEGFQWLAFLHEHDLGGILADDMGLGKTMQALALMCHVKEGGTTAAPFLVIAPTSVVENWALECRTHSPDLVVTTVTETVSRRGVKLATMAGDADLIITSYALFRLEYGDYESLEWAGMFLDEAQFAKNRASQAYQRAKMLPVRCKVAMTGTPMENNLMELWSLLSITAPGLFASPDRFTDHFRVPIEKKGDAERLAQLRRRMRPLMLRRTKEQVAVDLPQKQEQVLELELNPKHRKVYQTHLQRERQKVLGLLGDLEKNRFQIFRSLTLLRQASLDASLVDARYTRVPSTKLDALTDMVGEIVGDGHRVLVFSQFTRFLTSAAKRLDASGIDHCYLDGKTRKRPAVIANFRNGKAPVFLISLKAGGFGLNLTEADYCILLDPWWNPATEAQAVDRIHRIGQTRKVMVYRLVAKDTIEEKVMALKARKAALFASVIDAGGFESAALSAEDIRGLLS